MVVVAVAFVIVVLLLLLLLLHSISEDPINNKPAIQLIGSIDSRSGCDVRRCVGGLRPHFRPRLPMDGRFRRGQRRPRRGNHGIHAGITEMVRPASLSLSLLFLYDHRGCSGWVW